MHRIERVELSKLVKQHIFDYKIILIQNFAVKQENKKNVVGHKTSVKLLSNLNFPTSVAQKVKK